MTNTHQIDDPYAVSGIAIQRTRVESSAIVSLGYEAQSQVLEVEFSSARVYRYFDVPPNLVDQFWSAASKGSWFNEAIRDRFEYAPARNGSTAAE